MNCDGFAEIVHWSDWASQSIHIACTQKLEFPWQIRKLEFRKDCPRKDCPPNVYEVPVDQDDPKSSSIFYTSKPSLVSCPQCLNLMIVLKIHED